MPILNLNTPSIKRLAIAVGIPTTLPSASQATATFSVTGGYHTRGAFERTTLANWGTLNQMAAGSAMATVGAPRGDYSVGDQLYDGLMGLVGIENAALEILDSLNQALLGGQVLDLAVDAISGMVIDILSDIFDPLMGAIGSIPIFGWIVEAIWDVARGIAKLVKIFKEMNAPEPEKEYDLAAFGPGTDKDVADGVLKQMSTTQDWTEFFMPPGIGKEYNYSDAIASSKLTNGVGRRLVQTGHRNNPHYLGFIPGTNTIDQGFEIFAGRPDLDRSIGELFPTARNLCSTIWTQINQASPAMFTVDAHRARGAWIGHLFDLRLHLHEMKSTDGMSRTDAKNFVNGVGMNLFGWESWDAGESSIQGGLNPFGLENCTPAKHLQILIDRQQAYLNTSLVAYVDDSFPAIKSWGGNTLNLDRWEANRDKLLTHKARCGIDLSSIPSESSHQYKGAMEIAQGSCDPPGQLGLVMRPPPLNEPEPPPPAPGMRPANIVAMPPLQDELKKGSKASPLVVIAGVAALAWGGSKLVKGKR